MKSFNLSLTLLILISLKPLLQSKVNPSSETRSQSISVDNKNVGENTDTIVVLKDQPFYKNRNVQIGAASTVGVGLIGFFAFKNSKSVKTDKEKQEEEAQNKNLLEILGANGKTIPGKISFIQANIQKLPELYQKIKDLNEINKVNDPSYINASIENTANAFAIILKNSTKIIVNNGKIFMERMDENNQKQTIAIDELFSQIVQSLDFETQIKDFEKSINSLDIEIAMKIQEKNSLEAKKNKKSYLQKKIDKKKRHLDEKLKQEKDLIDGQEEANKKAEAILDGEILLLEKKIENEETKAAKNDDINNEGLINTLKEARINKKTQKNIGIDVNKNLLEQIDKSIQFYKENLNQLIEQNDKVLSADQKADMEKKKELSILELTKIKTQQAIDALRANSSLSEEKAKTIDNIFDTFLDVYRILNEEYDNFQMANINKIKYLKADADEAKATLDKNIFEFSNITINNETTIIDYTKNTIDPMVVDLSFIQELNCPEYENIKKEKVAANHYQLQLAALGKGIASFKIIDAPAKIITHDKNTAQRPGVGMTLDVIYTDNGLKIKVYHDGIEDLTQKEKAYSLKKEYKISQLTKKEIFLDKNSADLKKENGDQFQLYKFMGIIDTLIIQQKQSGDALKQKNAKELKEDNYTKNTSSLQEYIKTLINMESSVLTNYEGIEGFIDVGDNGIQSTFKINKDNNTINISLIDYKITSQLNGFRKNTFENQSFNDPYGLNISIEKNNSDSKITISYFDVEFAGQGKSFNKKQEVILVDGTFKNDLNNFDTIIELKKSNLESKVYNGNLNLIDKFIKTVDFNTKNVAGKQVPNMVEGYFQPMVDKFINFIYNHAKDLSMQQPKDSTNFKIGNYDCKNIVYPRSSSINFPTIGNTTINLQYPGVGRFDTEIQLETILQDNKVIDSINTQQAQEIVKCFQLIASQIMHQDDTVIPKVWVKGRQSPYSKIADIK